MDFKQYPSYKDSGVEWLGEVPEHWQVKKLKNIGTSIIGLTYSPSDICDANNESHLVMRSSNIQNGKISLIDNVYVNCEVSEKLKLKHNDILICSRNGSKHLIGKNIILKQPKSHYTFGAFMTVFRCKSPDFIYWVLNSIIFKAQAGSYLTTTVNQLTINNLNNMIVPFPSKEEQAQIVSFLDFETSRIDNLIAKQEKLIKLLEEHRKSVISHTVTKGLNPNAPMKNSDMEWLGEVPQHWIILQTRHVFSFSKGLTITKEDLSDEGVPCINYGEVHSKYGFEFNPDDNQLKSVSFDYLDSNKNCLLNKGDFIFADTSEDLEGSGNFSYLNKDCLVFAGYHSIIAKLTKKHNYRYLAYMFDSYSYRKQIQTEMKGVKVYSITQAVLKSRYAWLPPFEEQNKIVEFLDAKCKKIDLLIFKQKQLIKKLKEYRTSIISHAVTGKIDVRDLIA